LSAEDERAITGKGFYDYSQFEQEKKQEEADYEVYSDDFEEDYDSGEESIPPSKPDLKANQQLS